jgi:hypothetical protein
MMIFSAIICLWGCTQTTRVALDNYVNNQGLYKDSNILITANVKELLDNYEIIMGKDIEVTAPIVHFEERDAPSWYLVIGSEEKSLRAYETNYRRFIPAKAIYLARLAKKEGGAVVVRGSLLDSGIELDQLTYGEIIVNTNVPSSAA